MVLDFPGPPQELSVAVVNLTCIQLAGARTTFSRASGKSSLGSARAGEVADESHPRHLTCLKTIFGLWSEGDV